MDPILFDWDGTLADTLGAIYRANVAVMAVLGLPFDLERYRRHFHPDWRRMYGNLGVPDYLLEEANLRWWAAMDHGGTELLPGVVPALDRLAAAGHPLGLVTAGRSDRVLAELDRHGLAGRFGSIVCGDDLVAQKPDPAPLERALTALGWADRPDRAAYLGDTPDDMRMAAALGVVPVGIVSILGDPAELRATGAVEIASSVADWVERFLTRRPPAPAASAARQRRPPGDRALW